MNLTKENAERALASMEKNRLSEIYLHDDGDYFTDRRIANAKVEKKGQYQVVKKKAVEEVANGKQKQEAKPEEKPKESTTTSSKKQSNSGTKKEKSGEKENQAVK